MPNLRQSFGSDRHRNCLNMSSWVSNFGRNYQFGKSTREGASSTLIKPPPLAQNFSLCATFVEKFPRKVLSCFARRLRVRIGSQDSLKMMRIFTMMSLLHLRITVKMRKCLKRKSTLFIRFSNNARS